MPQYQWGAVTNTNGYNGYWPNPGVKTNGIGMITTRADRFAAHPILIGSIYAGYATGPASIWCGMYYRGEEMVSNGMHFDESGGVFDFFIRGSAGTLRFGRCEPCGNSVISENEAFSWGGTLVGSFDFAEVPTEVHIDVELEADGKIHFGDWSVDSNGGQVVTQIRRQMRVDGGSWGSDTSNWGDTVTPDPGHSYQFRHYARNAVGDGQYGYSDIIDVDYGGGRRMTGSSSSVPLSLRRIYKGSSIGWKDLTIMKRYTGSAWTDIDN